MSDLIRIITAADPALRNQSLDSFCSKSSIEELLQQCAQLDDFRRHSENLYERVRALFFLYAIHRFHIPAKLNFSSLVTCHSSLIPFKGYEHLLQRRFEEAIDSFLAVQKNEGPSDTISSALATAYHRLAFQTLANQVRRSVRSVRGNQWMFRMGHPADQPLRIRPELLKKNLDGSYPILRERTPVRMDLTHCGWSDIFFLGMDFPEGAKVLNVSIDLAVHGRDMEPRPPVEAYLRVIEEPVLRLVSVDLGARADITNLADVFDFAKDYLGLLKAAVIAAGIVPPGVEGSGQSLAELLARIVGEGRGLEIVSNVNNIPKGSRLAVSTNLLAALVSVCMRATRQAASLTGKLQENERRIVLARALLGEWLGGSGGGWQDSGGVWPGMKLIEGALAQEGDAEFGISRGRLMPTHRILDERAASPETRRKLQESLVLVHGGMAQNVGPILEMVTEKYLLRSEAEWKARLGMLGILDEILGALRQGDISAIGSATTKNFFQPIQTIIPWANNYFTETLIGRVRSEFKENFWGFWMLGGMSGGGMGFIFAPEKKSLAQQRLQEIMSQTKRELEHALPFAMEPVVYDFAINEMGTFADLLEGRSGLPTNYQALFTSASQRQKSSAPADKQSLDTLLEQHGFDRTQHEQIRADLKQGRIGLAQNHLPASAVIEDVKAEDVTDATAWQSGGTSLPSGAAVSVADHRNRPPTATETVATTVAGETPAPLSFQKQPIPLSPHEQQPVALPFIPFDKSRPATIKHRRLPHWQQEGATYFVTFRLVDSLPDSVLQRHLRERDEWLRRHGKNLTEERKNELQLFLREKIEEELDKGFGECVLKEPIAADIVENALRHFDGQRYLLGSYVVMPNHVHILVRPVMEHKLSDILHSWKSFTAHEVNKHLRRKGHLWQDESFDRIVRDEQELEKFSRYILENPQRANLARDAYRLGHGLAAGSLSEAAVLSGAAVPAADVVATVSVADHQSRPPTATETVATTMAGATPAPLSLVRRTLNQLRDAGLASLRNGEVAAVTLAAGAGSRWTQGAGVVKALHPFCKLGGKHRTFIETHLAKSRRISRETGVAIPHIFTTSYLTHEPITEFLARQKNYNYDGPLHLSPGKAVGLRLVPTERDLRFMWEEMPQQILDEQQQKVRDSLRQALINWARAAGEASDYTDNVPLQCLHPVGHWYEIPNLFRNGVLAKLLRERPQLKYLMLHNIDTLGADIDPALLGLHIESGACLTFELITRRIEDRGGGLARVNGHVRLVEGLAMPREELEFELSYYNSNTCWIDLDKLLAAFALTREDVVGIGDGTATETVATTVAAGTAAPLVSQDDSQSSEEKITAAIRNLAAKMPTYITLKDVKKRWGHGQEDIFPVAQWEKLWVDMTALPEIKSRFVVIPRLRGQQLKDQAQLDGWLRDGSAAHVESLCEWK